MFRALKVSAAILNLIQASMGSQWSLFKVNELETVKPVPVTTRARVFCVRWKTRDVFSSWNAIQNGVSIIESGGNKSSGNSAESCVVK